MYVCPPYCGLCKNTGLLHFASAHRPVQCHGCASWRTQARLGRELDALEERARILRGDPGGITCDLWASR
jgi:hypothetical protein